MRGRGCNGRDRGSTRTYSSEITCYNCEKKGHIARICPDNNEKDQSNQQNESNRQNGRPRGKDNTSRASERSGNRVSCTDLDKLVGSVTALYSQHSKMSSETRDSGA